MAIKKYFVLILAKSTRFCTRLVRSLFSREGIVAAAFWPLGRIIFKFGFFPFYKVFYAGQTKFSGFVASHRGRFFSFLNKSYIIHFFIIILSISVAVDSLRAAELREDNYGEKSLIYALITKEVYEELTEETLTVLPSQKVFSYLDRTASLESQRAVMETTDQESLSELITVTEGGAAVVKPNIMGAINPAEIGAELPIERSGIIEYAVQPGDTVSSIASKFKISSQTILWQNNLGTKGIIRPGDILEILPTTGVAHSVKKGETLGALSRKYGVEIDEIVKYNHLLSVNDISIGQSLIIPGGRQITTAIASAKVTDRGTPKVSPITSLFIPPSGDVSQSGFLWPTSVRRITQYYSWRHTGLDIAGPTGTPLYASDDGTVVRSGWSNGYGYNVVIDHGNGYKTLYGHASKLYVSAGDSVIKGQTIADMGSTGWSTGPHIHFEVIYKGAKQNPLSYIK